MSSAHSTLEQLAVTSLKGVGPRIAERLARLGIRTVQNLLFPLPYRYQDRTRVTPVGALQAGRAAGVVVEIMLCQVHMGRRRSLVCIAGDGTGRLCLRFFHFRQAQQRMLTRGVRIHCFGEVRTGPQGLEMVHPEYHVLGETQAPDVADHLTPSYPTTEGLHQLSLRKLSGEALALLDGEAALEDLLPADITRALGFPELHAALRLVHRPGPDVALETLEAARHPAQRRLAFEELLSHHLSLRLRRKLLEHQVAHAVHAPGAMSDTFIRGLPFTLTAAQRRVSDEIARDLQRAHPMHRLLQGDVGSGKTVVAALAALQALEAGFQVALMVPTEILAEQHLKSFRAWLDPLGVRIAWLSGKLTGRPRERAIEAIATRAVGLVIGTHALFQESVRFSRLGLVIVDEQHRFGVHQRLALLDKGRTGAHPHQLIMTATPIPRTLAMTAYADLDTSIIDALPPGRKAVETAVIPDSRRGEIIERVNKTHREGQQIYWVCTLIEESEALQCQAATDTAEALASALPALSVGLVHGRMKAAHKDAVMEHFTAGDIDLLVATTVIEVGVDVPNATLMVIENAERLGLAQLHQLRGRVGRGARKSVCLLLYHGPLSEHARGRLEALRGTNDGFEIARRDLALRGPGELLGTRQTGMPTLRIADLVRDQAMFPDIERVATAMLANHAERVPLLVRRWIGDAVNFADV